MFNTYPSKPPYFRIPLSCFALFQPLIFHRISIFPSDERSSPDKGRVKSPTGTKSPEKKDRSYDRGYQKDRPRSGQKEHDHGEKDKERNKERERRNREQERREREREREKERRKEKEKMKENTSK